MNIIHTAIMRAADKIEQRPELFDFKSTALPDANSCGTPGCALGWIAAYLPDEMSANPDNGFRHIGSTALVGLGIGGGTFYGRLDRLQPREWLNTSRDWSRDAASCAATLRLYADCYHAEPAADAAFTRFKALLAQDATAPQREREGV